MDGRELIASIEGKPPHEQCRIVARFFKDRDNHRYLFQREVREWIVVHATMITIMSLNGTLRSED